MSTQKAIYRTELDEQSDIILGIFRSYAKTTSNEELYASSDMSMTEIKRIKDSEIMALVHKITTYATAHLADLKDYGLTDDMLKSYTDAGKAYQEYLGKPDAIKAEKKTATEHMDELFKQLNIAFTDFLDNHMMQYKNSQAQFYSDYENARNIYDNPTTTIVLKGTVTDSDCDGTEDPCPLEFVKVSVKFKPGTALKENIRESSAKGNYQFKTLPEGPCLVTYELDYYQSQTIETSIRHGRCAHQNIQMIREIKQ